MNNLNLVQNEQLTQEIKQKEPIQCNKCGYAVEQLPTLESTYQSNYMHTFYPTLKFCGKDTGIDMQTCKFVLCQKCLFELCDSFKIKVKWEEDLSWIKKD